MKNKSIKYIEHITEAGYDFKSVIDEIDDLRKSYISAGDIENANTSWALKTIVRLHRDYRAVFELLIKKNYYEAWCSLEQIEIGISTLLKNFPGVKGTVEYLDVIVHQLQALFPYKVFLSTVLVIKQRVCSICGKKRQIRNHCGHFAGRVYAGELCVDIINSCEIKGADIVFNPQHKYAVAFKSGPNGPEDHYNYMLLESLMRIWTDPYYPWHYIIINTHVNPTEFPDLSDEKTCPCGSGIKYGDCCKKDPDGIKHIIFEFRPGLKQPLSSICI